MIRIVLERMVLFALPFALFASYVWIFHRRLQWPRPNTPWFWLTVSGLVLVILSFFYAGLTDGEPTSGRVRGAAICEWQDHPRSCR